jgi:hypothetical protein
MSGSGRAVILVIVIVISLALPRDQSAQAAASTTDARGNPSQSLAIVVNRSNPINNLSFVELRKIFLACIIHQRGIVSKRVIKSEGER